MTSFKNEWARMWPLPLVAMVGVTGAAMTAYSAGVFMEPVTQEFGWTRAEYFSAVSFQMILGIIAVPLIGMAVDRFGSRIIAIIGTCLFACGFSAFALANGSLPQWLALSFGMVVTTAFITQPVWVKPVVHRFDKSRGLAMAVVLSGNGVGTTIWPVIAAALIGVIGWRMAYPAMALGWAALSLPLTLLFFFDKDRGENATTSASPAPLAKGTLARAVRSRAFLLLTASGAAFSCSVFGATVHLVPMLRNIEVDITTASAIAGLVGIFAVIGRLGTGMLLDRFPAKPIGLFVFLLPLLSYFLIWSGDSSFAVLVVAAIALGLASGAEIDVVTFLASRQFDNRIFASVYAIVMASFGVAASVGPVTGGALYDLTGNYDLYLMFAAILSLVGATFLWFLPMSRSHDAVGNPEQ